MEAFKECPACGGKLEVTECSCLDCGLILRGHFASPLLSRLGADQASFVLAFLRARGNLSELEKQLGVSYPTIRNKLDEVNASLDALEAAKASGDAGRKALLARVASGDLPAAEALALLHGQLEHGA